MENIELDPNKIGDYEIIFPGGEFYIGSGAGRKGIAGRWSDHTKGRDNSPKYLQKTAQKYGGWDNQEIQFIVLANTETRQEALELEDAFIKEHWTENWKNPLLLNKKRDVMDPHCADISGENNPMYGKHHSEETKRKIGQANRGKKRTEEQRKHLSITNKGKNKGKKASPEARKKISQNHADISGENNPMFGKQHSEETKKKISISRSGEKNVNSKLNWEVVGKVREKYETGNYTNRQLSEEFDIEPSTISRVVNNKAWKIENKPK